MTRLIFFQKLRHLIPHEVLTILFNNDLVNVLSLDDVLR